MKNKLSIKSRVFLSFTIFIILIVNIFAFAIFSFVKSNTISETKKNLIQEFETIKTFIDLQKSGIFVLPRLEVEKINNLGFYFYIGNNDKALQKKYRLGFLENNNSIIFRGDYANYNIVLGKDNRDLEKFENFYYKMLLILNIFLIFLIFIVSYVITTFSLKPLFKLSDFLNNYNKSKNNKLLKNNYGKTEIGVLTSAINNFISQNNQILDKQKDFIQDVSHELKTPIMQIHSNIELIEDKITDEKIKQKLKEIEESGDSISGIISNLGFILRGEEELIKKEKVNIYDFLKDLIKKYKVQAEEKNIKIEIQQRSLAPGKTGYPQGVPLQDLIIKSNKYYLERLFGNLLQNSINYNSGNNKIIITINKNNIIIKDQGIGIENQELNKIFNRFYRNKNSGVYDNSGNGLGLSIVKKIIDMFGWQIEVKSEVGKGSEFKIIL